MFAKLRRKSRASVSSTANATPSVSASSGPNDSPRTATISFYGLPSELRIHIYELVAHDTRLSLFATGPKNVKAPSLLLVSHKVRTEYRPILLSIAPLRVHIGNYNFQPLMRVVGSLYSTELKALRTNTSLTIVLHLKSFNVTDENSITLLRRWAVKRAEHLDRLPWSYELARSVPSRVHVSVAVAQLERLERSMTAVRMLQKSVHESLTAEIEPVACLLLERCISWEGAISQVWRTGTNEHNLID